MWLVHFRKHRKHRSAVVRARYYAFEARYYEFRREDCVELCEDHHTKVHAFYIEIIRVRAAKRGKPCHKWSWKQAEALMNELRQAFDRWMKKQ